MGLLWHLVHDLIFQLDSKLLISLIKNILDGEHKEQPLQRPGKQHSSQQCQQQQLIDGVAPGYTKSADASSDRDPQSTPAKPPGSTATTATTTTLVQAQGILTNSPYHFLIGQGPNKSRRLA
jgi:hypothetical protein